MREIKDRKNAENSKPSARQREKKEKEMCYFIIKTKSKNKFKKIFFVENTFKNNIDKK